MTDFLAAHPAFRDVASVNKDNTSWDWSSRRREHWDSADDDWQKFAEKWRNIGEEIFHSESRVLNLTAFPLNVNCRLLIRDCYVEAEKVVWEWATDFPERGVIFTGQPGIGKTFFIWYLLVRLLQMKQVVLLHSADSPLLFWHDAVYTPTATSAVSLSALPKRSEGSHSFIWSLSDVPRESEPPLLATFPRWCFPVQAPYPSEVQYKEWSKDRTPLFAGFPLWTHEELARAAPLSSNFPEFWAYLEKAIKHWKVFPNQENEPKRSKFCGAIFLLQEHCGESTPKSTEEAFDLLLDALISRFGPIPRDVFAAMCTLKTSATLQNIAPPTLLQGLKVVAQEITSVEQFPDTSSLHRIICVNPVGEIGEPEYWQIGFKSAYIGKQVAERLFRESRNEMCSLITYFSSVPQGHGLAGSLFEPFVHRDITRGTASANPGSWSFRRMRLERPDGSKSPSFVLCDSGVTIGGFSKAPRTQILFDYKNLPDRLANDEYYVLDTPSLPLIDSFAVDLDFVGRSAHLWLLQITTSLVHKGSANVYLVIRKIIEKIREVFTEERKSDEPPPEKKLKGRQGKPSVRVHYVLVHPAGQVDPGAKWTLPKGWDDDVAQADHRGDGGLLEFPIRPE